MPSEVSPKKVQEAVQRGYKRLANFRASRMMFLRNYTGQYYDRAAADIGTEPLNLIFNAVRILVPNIVMSFPKHRVTSRFLASREYADLLGMGLSYHDKVINIKNVYRQHLVDAIFTLGIMKTGIAESGSILALDDYDHIDMGEVYTECVDFDNFVVDPGSKEHMFRDATFMGDRITVPRSLLLDSGLYKNDLVERLPRAGSNPQDGGRSSSLSMRAINERENFELQDEVEVVELWVPQAKAIVTVPAGKGLTFDDYLRVDDYNGPDTGPYTLLSLTPPVPGNPLPVPMVGVWNDLHTIANRMAKKIVDQAERQKDVVSYRRAAADDAQMALDAGDGDAIAMDDPDGVRVHSFGGQQQSNEAHLMQLQGWFNMMAANPQTQGGERSDAQSATAARILQSNASTGLDDMKDLVYQSAQSEASKRAWYFHTDPLIEVPLIKRRQVPAIYAQSQTGPAMVQPASIEEFQVFLTPEVRSGDFLDFTFEIQPESMGRKNGATQYQEMLEFAVRVVPAVAAAALTFFQLGIPFSPQAYISRMAENAGMDWLDEVFFDPMFQEKLANRMLMGPSPAGSQGQLQPNPNAVTTQNGQPGQVQAVASPVKQVRQGEQAGANQDQSQSRGGI